MPSKSSSPVANRYAEFKLYSRLSNNNNKINAFRVDFPTFTYDFSDFTSRFL